MCYLKHKTIMIKKQNYSVDLLQPVNASYVVDAIKKSALIPKFSRVVVT